MVTNKLGLHLRAASEVVKLASQFESDIELRRDDICVDAKSLLALLNLEAAQGVELEVAAEGSDEDSAVRAIVGLIEAKFNEEE